MLRKRTRLSAVSAAAALLLGVAACGGGGDGDGGGGYATLANCDKNPNSCNSAEQLVTDGEQRAVWALAKNIENWNLNSADGNTLEYSSALSGVLPDVFKVAPDFSIKLNKDLMVSAKQINDDPQTIEYKIQPDAKWSDGTPITAQDFIYQWKTLNGKDCPKCQVATTAGYDQMKSVEGSDNGKTVTVTYAEPFTDWKSKFSDLYPAHIAQKHGDLSTPEGLQKSFEWFASNVPEYSAGPFKIKNWVDNKALTLVPNENWYGKGPYLDRVVFRVITEASEMVPALANGEVHVIYPQPQADLVQRVKNIPQVSQDIAFGLSWEHYDFNLDNKFLKDEALRDAMFTAIDRQQVIDKTLGLFTDKAQVLNSHNLFPGFENYKDVVPDAHGSGNVEKAKQILTDAGYTIRNEGSDNPTLITPNGEEVPTMTIAYTVGNQRRETEVTLFKQMVKPLGVDVKLESTDDLGGTLVEGTYDIIVFAWVGGPFPFGGAVQLWTCDYSQSPPKPNGGNYGGYCNEQVSNLIQQAASSTDPAQAYQKLNKADSILSDDAYSLPLFQLPTFLATYDRYANIRSNPTNSTPTYNVGQWGVEAQ